ncbi:MAG TPA: nitroreductase [Candidatus Paceibacterota bacterium]|nr:nitroreductase [Candidatus Paceibacterota bacterium]
MLLNKQTSGSPCESTSEFALELMAARRTVLPKRLVAPGPDHAQLRVMLAAAATAPDYRQILPWRFVLVQEAGRARLADVFAESLLERDRHASTDQLERARAKAFRSPCLMLVVCRTGGPPEDVSASERLISAGCAIQNVLLHVTAMGFSSALTSGKAMRSRAVRRLFDLSEFEDALVFVNIGTALSQLRPIDHMSTNT